MDSIYNFYNDKQLKENNNDYVTTLLSKDNINKTDVYITGNIGNQNDGKNVFITASETGFSPLKLFFYNRLEGIEENVIRRIAENMRGATDGLYIALINVKSINQKLILIQDDRGIFYENNHKDVNKVWKDFYYAATYLAFYYAENFWKVRKIYISHLTGNGWLNNLALSIFDALYHLINKEKLSLKELKILNCCLSENNANSYIKSVISNINLQQRNNPTEHREIQYKFVDNRDLSRFTDGRICHSIDFKMIKVDLINM